MRKDSPYQIDRLTTLSELDALEKEWSKLVEEIPDVHIFQTWAWIRTWWIFFSEGRDLWLLTARDRQGKLVGLAPFMREEYRKGPKKLNIIAFIGTGPVCPTHLKILVCTKDFEVLLQAFLSFLFDQSDQWDVLRISSVVSNSAEGNLWIAAGGRIRIGGQVPSLYISLPADWETYIKTINSRLRRNLRSVRSKLEDSHPGLVNFSCIEEKSELMGAMEKLEELILNRCHAKGIPTAWDDPIFTKFHRTIAGLALDHGWLRLYTLAVDGRMISLIYNFRYKTYIYGYNMGYDVEWARYEPSRLLVSHSIQMAIEEQAGVYDLGRGEAEHKFSWTDCVLYEDEVLFSNSWKGDMWIRLGNMERGLRINAKKFLERNHWVQLNQFFNRNRKTAKEEGSDRESDRTGLGR